MTKMLLCVIGALAISGLSSAQGPAAVSSTRDSNTPAPRPSAQIPAAPLYKLEDALLEWPLAPSEKAYSAIDGKHIHEYVEDLTAISRKYRDSGHPQFWGRIIGTQADTDTAEWVVEKFKKFGLTDVHIQPFDLPPQWMPQSWEITATGSGKTLHLESAQPAYQTKATTPEGGPDFGRPRLSCGRWIRTRR